jgi:AcrR family transcriptional regulator
VVSSDLDAVAPAEDEVRGGQATGGRVLTARGRRTRALLVAAAGDVFASTPFPDTRVADITAHAGVASGTFYTYFDSKEEVFREVAAEALAEMSGAARRDPDNVERDPIRDIAFASRSYFRACLRKRGIALSIEQLATHDAAVAAVRHGSVVSSVKRAERWIRDLQVRGICDEAVDPWTTAMALHTMNVRVAYDHLLLANAHDDASVEALVAAVTRIWARTVGLERVPARG